MAHNKQKKKRTIIMREKEDNKEAKSRKDEPELFKKKIRTINRNTTRKGRITLLQINAQSQYFIAMARGRKRIKRVRIKKITTHSSGSCNGGHDFQFRKKRLLLENECFLW